MTPPSSEDEIELVVVGWVGAVSWPLNLSVHLAVDDGTIAFATTSPPSAEPTGGLTWVVRIPPRLLNSRGYSVSVYVVKDESEVIVAVDRAVEFRVTEGRTGNWYGRWPGVLRPTLGWRTRHHTTEYEEGVG